MAKRQEEVDSAQSMVGPWWPMSASARIVRLIGWRIALIAAVTTHSVVLLHELAHLVALEAAGIDADLRIFSMGGRRSVILWILRGLGQRRPSILCMDVPLRTRLCSCDDIGDMGEGPTPQLGAPD
jgi:hypothetical protein